MATNIAEYMFESSFEKFLQTIVVIGLSNVKSFSIDYMTWYTTECLWSQVIGKVSHSLSTHFIVIKTHYYTPIHGIDGMEWALKMIDTTMCKSGDWYDGIYVCIIME